MSDEKNPNRTVFRPSPLQKMKEGQPPPEPAAAPPSGFGAPQPQAPYAPAPQAPVGPPPVAAERLADDDIPQPDARPDRRNPLLADAGPILALAASVRTGRAQIRLPDLHRQASGLIAAFDAAQAGRYDDETRRRARYALCATFDDIAQNLPGQGQDASEWARRSLVVQSFQENIGGERFWQLLDDMLTKPGPNADLIELFHACLAAGFEGRFRVEPDGKRRLHEIMAKACAALVHVRNANSGELSPRWKGHPTPVGKIGFWTPIALVGAAVLALLLIVYVALRLMLAQSGQPTMQALRAVNPEQPSRLSRAAPAPAVPSGAQQDRIRAFLAPEIAQRLVVVESDATSVRVRTTVGQLFQSGSDQLEPGRRALFERIAAAVETEKGSVKIEGHADSDRVSTVTFPDNFALSKARALVVEQIVRAQLSDGSRVASEGYGDSQPIASNATAEGKALNRRVEIVIPRNG